MMREVGFCHGIENYSRWLDGRDAGEAPYTLLDYFPPDFLMVIDESHVAVPQVGGMYKGDRSRKETLVEFGFPTPVGPRQPPIAGRRVRRTRAAATVCECDASQPRDGTFQEPRRRADRATDRSAGTRRSKCAPRRRQVDDLLKECRDVIERGFRVLVTTLTKRMAEELTDYLGDAGVAVRYLHSDIDSLKRTEILRDLRLGVFDVLVGINLLREGLDLPEVALVAILDADREGFLRSETSLIQTFGRAARNDRGKVVLYADKITDSMRRAMDVTNARREKQRAYNEEHGNRAADDHQAHPTAVGSWSSTTKSRRPT